MSDNIELQNNNPPKVITHIQNYVSPMNALYMLPVTIAGVLDFLSPYGAFLLMAAIITGVFLIVTVIRRKSGKEEKGTSFISQHKYGLILISFLIFSASALANFANHNHNGLLATWIPKVKTWQDAYLVSIKEDTDTIKKQNTENGAKIDKTNMMLAQLLDNIRPQLEKPLVEQIKGYKSLPAHQQNALLLFTSKVGVNGIQKYKGLIKAANTYAENQTPENAKAVAEHLDYIVRVNGKDIQDTKTKKLLMALFLDPETYNYLMGQGDLPKDQSLIKELNIDVNKPVGQQLDDPLGDFIKTLTDKGAPIDEKVVIPADESINSPVNQTESKSIYKKHKAVKTNGVYLS